MNTKAMLIAALLIALSASAADVPYTPGVNPGRDEALARGTG